MGENLGGGGEIVYIGKRFLRFLEGLTSKTSRSGGIGGLGGEYDLISLPSHPFVVMLHP